MLQELRIKNLAIIDELNLTFSKGLNILSGETGAGNRSSLTQSSSSWETKQRWSLIRSSEEEASIEALFDTYRNRAIKEKMRERFQRFPGKEEEDSLLVRRVISRSGKGKAFINGNLATSDAFGSWRRASQYLRAT